jgi:hypothetical protein
MPRDLGLLHHARPSLALAAALRPSSAEKGRDDPPLRARAPPKHVELRGQAAQRPALARQSFGQAVHPLHTRPGSRHRGLPMLALGKIRPWSRGSHLSASRVRTSWFSTASRHVFTTGNQNVSVGNPSTDRKIMIFSVGSKEPTEK